MAEGYEFLCEHENYHCSICEEKFKRIAEQEKLDEIQSGREEG